MKDFKSVVHILIKLIYINEMSKMAKQQVAKECITYILV